MQSSPFLDIFFIQSSWLKSCVWIDPANHGILEIIRRHLVPDAAGVTAELHKLNIYRENGFFAKHKDTPRAETQFGSLVVCLPLSFEGGQLRLSHGSERSSLDWGKRMLPYLGYRGYSADAQKQYDDKKNGAMPDCGLQWAGERLLAFAAETESMGTQRSLEMLSTKSQRSQVASGSR